MNNQIPYFMPQNPMNFNQTNEIERLNNKVTRLEKNIRILENRVLKLEGHKTSYNNYDSDDQSDMYII